MSGEMSFPVERMREIAQRILSSTDDLLGQTQSQMQQVFDATSGAPSVIRAILDEVLSDVFRDVTTLLEQRRQLGQNLMQAAEMAEQTEQDVMQSFEQQ
jgi:uncharacterized protein YukE